MPPVGGNRCGGILLRSPFVLVPPFLLINVLPGSRNRLILRSKFPPDPIYIVSRIVLSGSRRYGDSRYRSGPELVAQLHGVNVVPLIQMILIHVHLPFLCPSLQQVCHLHIERLG